MDKALKDEKNIAITIKAFGLSDSFANEVQVGIRDFHRKKELEGIEGAFRAEKLKPSEMISFSQKSLILARELEFPKLQILGIIDRNNRIANEYGSKLNVADAIYDAAWTIFWWYDDTSLSSLNKSTQKHNNSMDCQPYAKHRFRQNGAVFLYGFWTP